MSITDFCTRRAAATADAAAPDGSEVRLLCATPRGGMALFTLAPGMVSKAVAHRSVEEIWYFTRGRGRMWRQDATREEIVEIGPGLSIAIPAGTRFQFRSEGEEAIEAVGVTMPPWPGMDEAYVVEGIWPATFDAGDAG
ncbi:MAG TPA: cupin domain-containing protein [Stellaceae bacterium]|nr:cupin domain-containing protein [Stellaceae bacterium]